MSKGTVIYSETTVQSYEAFQILQIRELIKKLLKYPLKAPNRYAGIGVSITNQLVSRLGTADCNVT